MGKIKFALSRRLITALIMLLLALLLSFISWFFNV